MSELQDGLNEESKVSSIQKTTEDKTTSVITDEEIDNSLIVENDGDIFWTLHRIAWGTIKGALLIGMIFFTVWFIWSDDEISSDINIEKIKFKKDIQNEKGIKKISKEISDNLVPTRNIETYTIEIVKKAYELDEKRLKNVSGILSASIIWLKKAKSLGEISMTILRIEEPSSRAKKIESTLQAADRALRESAYLQKNLNNQIKVLLYKKNKLEKESLVLENKIFGKISRFNPDNINVILAEKIEKEKEIIEVAEEGKIRETLLKNIQNFDNLLRTKWIPLVRPAEMSGVRNK